VARKKTKSIVYMVSVGAHLAVGLAIALIPQEKFREVVAIALNEAPEKKKAEPPKPPEHHEDRPSHAPGHNARPAAAAAAEAEANPASANAPVFTDIGLALDSSASDGIAVNMAQPVAAPLPQPVMEKPKVLTARVAEVDHDEPIQKAHIVTRVRPSYTESARHAHIEGVVRLELMVNEDGDVVSARVLQGLGYGLDEAAMAAAKRFHFKPATKGGRSVTAPFIIKMRFVLGQ
jgi:protein TonB